MTRLRGTGAGAIILVAASVALTVPAAAQHTLTLDNGDRLTGRLKEIRDTVWVFSFEGTDLKILLARVAGLATRDAIGLRLTDGTVLAASVHPTPDGLALRTGDGAERLVRPPDVEAVGAADDLDALRKPGGLFSRLLERWGATGSLGFSDKRGNSRARGFSAGIRLTRKAPGSRLDLGATATREEAETPTGAFETRVSKAHEFFQADLYVSRRVFITGVTRQERDRFQDLSLRSTYTAGVGYQAAQTDRTDLRLNLLLGFRREDYVSAAAASNAIVGVAAAFRQRVGPVVFDWRSTWDPRASDFADFRFVSNATVTTRLVRGLGVQLAVLEEYNSRPRPDVEGNDLLITTTLTYSIGSR